MINWSLQTSWVHCFYGSLVAPKDLSFTEIQKTQRGYTSTTGKQYRFKLFDLRSIWLRPSAWEDDFYYWNTETDETTWDIEVGVPRLDGDIPVAPSSMFHIGFGVDFWPQWWILWPECFYDIPGSSNLPVKMKVNRDLTSTWNLFVLCFVAKEPFKIRSVPIKTRVIWLGSRYLPGSSFCV